MPLIEKYNAKMLSSYIECKNKDLSIIRNKDFFLDSGAFSVFSGASENIDINKYISFIKKNKIKKYAGLDVIGNAEKTTENWEVCLFELHTQPPHHPPAM